MVQLRTAALLVMAALVAADPAPIDCGRPDKPNSGTSSGTVYHLGSSDFDIRCHQYAASDPSDYVWLSSVANMAACVENCANDNTCLAAAYFFPGQGCYLSKTVRLGVSGYNDNTYWSMAYKKTPAITPPAPVSLNCKDKSSNGTIFTLPGSTTQYQILCDYQYSGNALAASKPADTFEQCVGFCDTTTDCVDVVYSDAKYCWLKSSKTNGYASGGWNTAVKVTNTNTNTNTNNVGAINCFDGSADKTVYNAPGGSYDIRCNFQYDGDVLGSSKRTETFQDCVSYCDANPSCVDAVWSSGKYCWLKSSKKGNGYNSGGWFSAIRR